MKRILTSTIVTLSLVLVIGVVWGAEQVGFTAGNDATSLGVLWGQPAGSNITNGWSGGTNSYFFDDTPEIDNGNGTYGDEKVMRNGMAVGMWAHWGDQFWRFSRGARVSSGNAGTPFTPALGGAVPTDADTLEFSFWFKPVSTNAGDDCVLVIETRRDDGVERSEIFGYLWNSTTPGQFHVQGLTGAGGGDYVDVCSNMDRTVWHKFRGTIQFNGSSVPLLNGTNYDYCTLTVDGTSSTKLGS